MSDAPTIAATAYAEGVSVVEAALSEAAKSQWDGRRADLHRPRRRLIELRRGVPNDKADPEAQAVRDLLTLYATVLEETSQRTEYHRGLELTQDTRAELDRLRRRASHVGLDVLDESSGEFRRPRREERPRVGRPEGAPRAPRPAGRDARPAQPAADGAAGAEDGAPKKRRRRRRSRGSASPAG